jgi:chromosome segregation ATPase
MSEVTVNVDKLEAKFDEKLAEKNNEIKSLKASLDELNRSVTKAAVDTKDSEIKTLTDAMKAAAESEKTIKVLAEQRETELKNLQAELKTLQETVKTKADELDKVNKELNDIKAKELVASRIKAYRDKSKDVTSKDEDLAKKFAMFSDEAFQTMVEFVKPVETPVVVQTEEEKAAKALAAVKDAKVSNPDNTAPAPTASESNKDSKRETAAKLIASVFGPKETKKE